ncbi:MAG TPA: hypothetical protein VK715_04945 [Steroidobacteraceae bacterium]|jgi:hypothetical protein|nr:hypothetical protein [Steroidobacteraceae bacterium]
MSRTVGSRPIGTLWRTAAFMAVLGMAASNLAGCISSRDLKSHELLGGARPALPADSVQLYLEPPSRRYVEIAVLHSSSRRSWSFTAQSKADVVVRRLKEEAASLGANGVLLQEIADRPGTAVDTDLGANYMGPRGTVDLGIGVSAVTLQRYGSAIAIYLPP